MNSGHTSRHASFPDLKRVVPITAVLERYGLLGNGSSASERNCFGIAQFITARKKNSSSSIPRNRSGDVLATVTEVATPSHSSPNSNMSVRLKRLVW